MFKRKRRIRRYSGTRKLKKKTPISARAKKRFISFLFVLTTVFLIYLVFFSNYFLVKQITVVEENAETEAISEKINSAISNQIGKNLIFIDLDDITSEILSKFPELQDIKLDKDYPSTIAIEFSEYPLVANIISETNALRKSFIINSIGYAIKEDLENPDLPYIRIKSDEPINPLASIIEVGKLEYILNAIQEFEDKFGMGVKEVSYKKIPREVHLLTDRDFNIWLDIQVPAETQFKKLKKALVKLDIYTENLDYIDLRIAGNNGDKIIYKRL